MKQEVVCVLLQHAMSKPGAAIAHTGASKFGCASCRPVRFANLSQWMHCFLRANVGQLAPRMTRVRPPDARHPDCSTSGDGKIDVGTDAHHLRCTSGRQCPYVPPQGTPMFHSCHSCRVHPPHAHKSAGSALLRCRCVCAPQPPPTTHPPPMCVRIRIGPHAAPVQTHVCYLCGRRWCLPHQLRQSADFSDILLKLCLSPHRNGKSLAQIAPRVSCPSVRSAPPRFSSSPCFLGVCTFMASEISPPARSTALAAHQISTKLRHGLMRCLCGSAIAFPSWSS